MSAPDVDPMERASRSYGFMGEDRFVWLDDAKRIRDEAVEEALTMLVAGWVPRLSADQKADIGLGAANVAERLGFHYPTPTTFDEPDPTCQLCGEPGSRHDPPWNQPERNNRD